MSWQQIREKINLFIYDSKQTVLSRLKIISICVSAIAIGALVYYHGYEQTPDSANIVYKIITTSFAFYIFHYLARIFYDFSPITFIKQTWFEGIIILVLIIEGLSSTLFNHLIIQEFFIDLGFESFSDFYGIFLQVYLFILVGAQISRSSGIAPKFRMHPANLFILSFVALISFGAFLLTLPEMTTTPGSMNILDAFFTSTSTTCVTGLIVVDTATFFTFKGKMVLLILMKLGGLNIIAFGYFFALALKIGVGVRQHNILEDFVNEDSVHGTKGLLGRIVIWSTAIELVGSALLYIFWSPEIPFKNVGERIFYSVFHGVSAFNNAGMSLFSGGMYDQLVQENFIIHIIITILVFMGALGFIAIFDLFGLQNMRTRLKYPWKQISFASKISLYFSIGLVVFGGIMFYILESNNTLQGMNIFEATVTSIFQSVTRTSGFNTVDIGAAGIPMLLVLTFLMFVGSSSSSTGGGIKTSTFAILCASVYSTIRGKKNVELFKRSISADMVGRAFAVFCFFVAGNLVFIFLLTVTESHILAMPNRTVMDIIFEQVSAMGTVGLSMGITSDLSGAGKIIILLSMFVGRVGTLTVALLFSKKIMSTDYKYPSGHTLIG